MTISPIKVVAGIAAVVLAIAGLFYASQARQATADLMSTTRLSLPKTSAPAAPANVSAAASGVKVIPIGVAEQPNAAAPRASTGR